MRLGLQVVESSSSGSVSIMAKPQEILPFSPSQRAAAVCGEWKRILQPFSSSLDNVAKVQPYLSSSLHAFAYSAIRSLFMTSSVNSSDCAPEALTKPSNIDRAANTSTVLAPQAQPISRPLKPSGRAIPRFTSLKRIRPS